MKLWEQLLRGQSLGAAEARHDISTIDDWISLWSGDMRPFLTQTWPPDKEQAATSETGAYKMSGPVFSLIQARMQVFSQARFAWTRFDAGKPGDLFGSRELACLERPWRGGTTADLLARMEVQASLAGTSYVRRIDRNGTTRLRMLNPLWVTVVIGSDEDADHPAEAGDAEIVGWLYTPPNARGVILLPDQRELAMYAPIPDPDNNFLGMSWITPVLTDIDADSLAIKHKRKFFENAASPNLALKFDPTVKPDMVREFKTLIEADHKGLRNAYKTLFLGGGADPVVIGRDMRQMDFANLQGKGESRLAAAAGVPPSYVGFSEGLQGSALNAGNFAAARRRFGDGTMSHLWGNAAASLEEIVKRPQGAKLWYDIRGIPFMREDAKDAAAIQAVEAETINALVREGFTAESAIKAVKDGGNWAHLVHTGLVSVQLQEPGSDPNNASKALRAALRRLGENDGA